MFSLAGQIRCGRVRREWRASAPARSALAASSAFRAVFVGVSGIVDPRDFLDRGVAGGDVAVFGRFAGGAAIAIVAARMRARSARE